MKSRFETAAATALLVVLCLTAAGCGKVESETELYESGPASKSGTGKFYMGREIARVMGPHGVAWLERPERTGQERLHDLVERLDLAETDVIADIGAGSGYVTFMLSPKVPRGQVLAVEIQQEMLDIINRKQSEVGTMNVQTILGSIEDPALPEGGVDVTLIVDSYHEFSHPREMIVAIRRGLKPGGRLVLVEFRGEDPGVPIKPIHKMAEAQIRKEIEATGLVWRETADFLPRHHVMTFVKP